MGKRNPNNYGSVSKLSGNRSRPWVVRITVKDVNGNSKQVPLDYTKTEEEANILLAQYNDNPWQIDRNKITLLELYNRWAQIKLPRLGKASQGSLRAAFKHCSKYYGKKYRAIRASDMQDCIDNCDRGYSTQNTIKNLWGHLDKFAFEYDIINKMYSQIITGSPIPDTTKTPFTDEQIEALWQIKDDPWVDTVLIYLYTGFRLAELLGMKTEQVNMKEKYFQNGVKTAAGKGRIVPIHPRIEPFVQALVEQGNEYLFSTKKGKKIQKTQYYRYWDEVMAKIGADKKPHETRHTFVKHF